MKFQPYLFWLLVGHALADYPLQGDFLAKLKNHRIPIESMHPFFGLFWHAIIHAGAVALVTNSMAMALLELVLHMAIDWLKCENITGFNVDQCLHILCKLIIAGLMVSAYGLVTS